MFAPSSAGGVHVGDELLRKFDDIVRGLDESGASREIATYNIGRTNGVALDERERERDASESGDDSDALSEDSGEPRYDERASRQRPQQQPPPQQQQTSKQDASLDLLEASADSAAHVMARAPERPAYTVASNDAPPARLPPAPPQVGAAPLQLYGSNTIVVATASAVPPASANPLLAGRRTVSSGSSQVQQPQPGTNSAVQRAVASPAFGDVQESVRRKFEELLDLSSADQWAPPSSTPVRAPMQASAMPTRALLPNAGSLSAASAQAPVQAQLAQAAAAGRAHATAVAAGMGRLALHQQQQQQSQLQPQPHQQQQADGANSVDAVDSDHEHSHSDDVGSDGMSSDSESREFGRGRSRGAHHGKSPRSQRSFTSARSGRSDAVHGRLYETGLRQYQQRELSPHSPRSHTSSMTPRTRALSETRFQGARAEQYAAMLYQEGMKHKADRERLQRRVAKQRARQEMQGVTFHPVRVTEPDAARRQRRREREVAVVFDRLYTMGKAHRRYIEQLSERVQAEELGKLTFTPQINEDNYNDTLSHNGAAANGDIHTRLYTLARRSMVVRESAQREREQNELAPCTFTPEINRAKTPERSTSALETSNRLYKLGQARAARRARAAERSASDLPAEAVGSARRTSRASIDRLAMPRAIATPRRSSDSVTPRRSGSVQRVSGSGSAGAARGRAPGAANNSQRHNIGVRAREHHDETTDDSERSMSPITSRSVSRASTGTRRSDVGDTTQASAANNASRRRAASRSSVESGNSAWEQAGHVTPPPRPTSALRQRMPEGVPLASVAAGAAPAAGPRAPSGLSSDSFQPFVLSSATVQPSSVAADFRRLMLEPCETHAASGGGKAGDGGRRRGARASE